MTHPVSSYAPLSAEDVKGQLIRCSMRPPGKWHSGRRPARCSTPAAMSPFRPPVGAWRCSMRGPFRSSSCPRRLRCRGRRLSVRDIDAVTEPASARWLRKRQDILVPHGAQDQQDQKQDCAGASHIGFPMGGEGERVRHVQRGFRRAGFQLRIGAGSFNVLVNFKGNSLALSGSGPTCPQAWRCLRRA